ncbi:serine/threonine-protein kinase [Chondromyces crocatus]|uniref:Protein kinase n=1 Tax=Chondromyces crocatus TaxID=52 RepID=A0A0K1EDZ4_CHOCO|nr:serine/threonine-protein kinase [Chondromyces crocatus]AKT38808.1 protein kinase [Chondromyces crocatus]
MVVTPGSIVGGKYRIERPLSRGGMGAVWAARHVLLGSPVALKLMDQSFASSPAFVARFEREARTAAQLESPHVVRVADYGVEDGTPYLVMELLEGEDLSARLKRVGRLSLIEATEIVAQAGKAVRRAHAAGLVHRDLKPGNLFLAQVDEGEIVKVLDFGIVKETRGQILGEVTRTGEVLGSPHFMSPEQIRGERNVDHRSDLWSLGVILYRALTGVLPFGGDQLGAVMAKILIDPFTRATQLVPELPPQIDEFFQRALARDRLVRFQSVREMIEELQRIAGVPSQLGAGDSYGHSMVPVGATTTLGNLGSGDREEVPVKRSKRVAAMLMSGGLALLTAGVILTVLWQGERESASSSSTPADMQVPFTVLAVASAVMTSSDDERGPGGDASAAPPEVEGSPPVALPQQASAAGGVVAVSASSAQLSSPALASSATPAAPRGLAPKPVSSTRPRKPPMDPSEIQ